MTNQFFLDVEKLPMSQEKFQDNSEDDIYVDEEDLNDVSFSPSCFDDDSLRSSEAWSEPDSQQTNVGLFSFTFTVCCLQLDR